MRKLLGVALAAAVHFGCSSGTEPEGAVAQAPGPTAQPVAAAGEPGHAGSSEGNECADHYMDDLRGAEEYSHSSAKEVVPLALELVDPDSVVDVGCGLGNWLAVFQERGVEDFLGIDGYWIDKDKLAIPVDKFMVHDLENPLKLDRSFDLVVSLEVAEHLSPAATQTFIDTLTALGPVILFSAGIPNQPGYCHQNGHWQHYWAGLFEKRGYVAIDAIRKRVWSNERVGWWYAQNMLLYVRRDQLARNERLQQAFEATAQGQLSVVHPELYQGIVTGRFGRLVPH